MAMAATFAAAAARPCSSFVAITRQRRAKRVVFNYSAQPISSSSSSESRKLILYSKPGCCLCDGLKEKLHAAFSPSSPDHEDAGANIFIKEDLKIRDSQVEILVGILNMCALVGALCAGRTSDYIGHRYTIVVASIIFMVGSILMSYGPNYAILMLGRCTAGIGVGFALMISPVYSAEISSNSKPSSSG